MLTALTASGSKMAVGDAAITAILGYAVVFVGLVLLMAVTIIFGKIMVSRKKKSDIPAEEAAPIQAAAQGPVAPGSAGDLKLYNVSDRDAALIMAIVADKMGLPINELRFKSIKEIDDNEI